MGECTRVTEVSSGVVVVKKCGCQSCGNRKAATEAFYQKFDLLYQQYNLNKDLNVLSATYFSDKIDKLEG